MRVIFKIIICTLFYILVYCGLLKRAELRGVKWTTKLQKLTCCCCWNHIMKSQKKNLFFWNLPSFKNEFFPPFIFHLFFTPKCGRLLWKSMHFEVCFPFFCKNWKNIFKLWGLSEIYIIDNRWSVLNRQIGDGKMCMQNSENEWVVCLRLRGYNMTTVLSLYGLCHKKSQNDPTKTPNDSCKF